MAVITVHDAGVFYCVMLSTSEGSWCGGNFYHDRKLLRPTSRRTKESAFAEAMELAEQWAEELRGVKVEGKP